MLETARSAGSPLAEGAHDLIVQRLGEVGEDGAVVSLDELDRHPRHRLHVLGCPRPIDPS
jgi:hypothetical protein